MPKAPAEAKPFPFGLDRIVFFSDAGPTGLLFSNPIQAASVVLYAGAAAGMGLSLAWVWIYAMHHNFVTTELPRALVRVSA